MDSLFDDVFDDWNSVSVKFPPVDVYESPEAYVMQAELPGYEEKDIELNIDNHVLHFKSGKRTEENKHAAYLVRERYTKPFERSFILPENVNEEACFRLLRRRGADHHDSEEQTGGTGKA
jgi:spore coat protein M/HSP20 family protein